MGVLLYREHPPNDYHRRGEGVLPTTLIAVACCCSPPSLTDGSFGRSSPQRLQGQPMSKLSHIDPENAALQVMD
jgi:hypothetical protein